MPMQKSSGFNTALQIGKSLGGAQTYMSLAAPAAGDIQGFEYGTTKLGAGGGSVGGIGTFGPNYGFRN